MICAIASPCSRVLPKMSEPHRLHPAAIMLWTLRFARELFIPAIIPLGIQFFRHGLDILNAQTMVLGAAGLLVLLLASGTYGVLAWRRFTYRIDEGELRVEQGVISRNRRFIPLERIQAVDLSQGLLQRLLGVVRVQVETAGGGRSSPEVSLAAVSRDDANRLRRALAGQHETLDERPQMETPAPVRRLAFADLLIAGSTSGRVGIALSIVVSIIAFADDLIPFDAIAGQFGRLSGFGAVVLAALLFAGFVWFLGVLGTTLAHAGFTLTRDGDNLTIERGLLERRHATIPIDRIQSIRVVEGIVRQPFGLVELRIDSAGYGEHSGESTVLFPLLRRDDVLPFLREMTPALAALATFNQLPSRARRRYALRLSQVGPAIALAALPAIALFPLGLVALLLIPAVMLLGLWQYRTAGWVVENDTLLLRWRILSRTTVILPRRRIQQAESRRTPFQRRVRLATFAARVASGGSGAAFDLQHMDDAEANRLLVWFAAGRRTGTTEL